MNPGKWSAWLWKGFTLPIVAIVYITTISEGARTTVPPLALRLYKLPLPGLSMLRDFEATYRLDIAHCLSVVFLVAVWYLWKINLKAHLTFGEFAPAGWDPEKFRTFALALGVLILGADACLFYIGMAEQVGWGTKFSFSALLATAAYVGLVLFVSFMSVNLETSSEEEQP